MISFFLTCLFAQVPMPPATTTDPKQTQEQLIASLKGANTQSGVLIIDPKARASDYKEAFTLLKSQRPTAKITFTLNDGTTIEDVTELKTMTGDTLVLFRSTSNQGEKIQVIGIEQIRKISQ